MTGQKLIIASTKSRYIEYVNLHSFVRRRRKQSKCNVLNPLVTTVHVPLSSPLFYPQSVFMGVV